MEGEMANSQTPTSDRSRERLLIDPLINYLLDGLFVWEISLLQICLTKVYLIMIYYRFI